MRMIIGLAVLSALLPVQNTGSMTLRAKSGVGFRDMSIEKLSEADEIKVYVADPSLQTRIRITPESLPSLAKVYVLKRGSGEGQCIVDAFNGFSGHPANDSSPDIRVGVIAYRNDVLIASYFSEYPYQNTPHLIHGVVDQVGMTFDLKYAQIILRCVHQLPA